MVMLAAIGDVIMALPMMHAICAAFPDVRIAWMCGRTIAPLFRRVEGIDEVIALNEVATCVTGIDNHRAAAFPFPGLSTSLPASLERRLAAFNRDNKRLAAITPEAPATPLARNRSGDGRLSVMWSSPRHCGNEGMR